MQELDLVWFIALLGTPLFFSLFCIVLTPRFNQIVPWFATLGGAIALGISLGMTIQFKYDTVEQLGVLDDENTRLQTSLFERGKNVDLAPDYEVFKSYDWVSKVRWIPRLGINFTLGLDGLNLSILILTALIYFTAFVAVWIGSPVEIAFFPLVFLSEFGLFGTLLATDGLIFLAFLAITILSFYFMLHKYGGITRHNSALVFGAINSIAILIFAGILTYCYKTNSLEFSNKATIEIAKNQLEREHPDWSEKQRTEYLSHHSFNTLAFQRNGISQLTHSNDNTKRKNIFATVIVLVATLLMGFSPSILALIYKTYDQSCLPFALVLAGVFPLLGVYIFIRLGVQIFPEGIVRASQVLSWIMAGLTLLQGFAFLLSSSPSKFIALVSCWLQLICYLGITTSFSGSPDIWKVKTFSGSLIWLLSGHLCLAGLVLSWRQLKDQIPVDIIDFKLGALKSAPFTGYIFAIFMFAVLACPGSINSIGMFLLAGSVMQFGLIPALLLGFSFVLVIISCYRILNFIFGDSFSTPTLFDLKYQKMILILIIFLPVVSLGIFPNIFLSWYMPSTSAIAELIQNALVK